MNLKEVGNAGQSSRQTEEIKGKVTGDKGLQLKGKARQKVGRVKEAAKAVAYDMEHSRKETKP